MKKIARLAIKKTLKRKKKWTKKLSPSLQASDTEEDFYLQFKFNIIFFNKNLYNKMHPNCSHHLWLKMTMADIPKTEDMVT
jgi:hypothetical protein